MKNSGSSILFVVACIAVLFAAYGIGLCVREVRFQQAAVRLKVNTQPQISQASRGIQKPSDKVQPVNEPAEVAQTPSEERPAPPDNAGRMPFGGLSEEERNQARDRRQNMSDEERAQEREKRMAEMEQMKAKMENMSEEEREKMRSEMRQRFGNRQSSGRRPDRGQQQQSE